MIEAKIQFSNSEMELMSDAEIILTKNRILQKVKNLLENLQSQMVQYSKVSLSADKQCYFNVTPKISRGENYNGLPYLILDYPRNFSSENIFALRTMFWWGNFFSITLHLLGNAKTNFLDRIINAYELLTQYNFSISINDDPWQHHFEPTNYIQIKSINKADFISICTASTHIKIASQWPVNKGATATNEILFNWILLVKVCLT